MGVNVSMMVEAFHEEHEEEHKKKKHIKKYINLWEHKNGDSMMTVSYVLKNGSWVYEVTNQRTGKTVVY